MSWETILIYSSVFLLIFYIMICAGYLVFHRYFIIFPSRRLSANPSDFQLQYEDVYFSTVDRVLLNGWLIKGEPEGKWSEFTILLFSGNKGTMSDFLPQMKQLTGIGFNIFLFGYRGFGKSQKKWPTEEGVEKDSEAACEYLLKEKKIPEKKIVFLGQSLGCAMASRTAQRFEPCALILEGGFSSIADVAARAVRWLPIKVLTRSRFDTQKHLSKVACPVMIMHSRDDKAIPLYDADTLLKPIKGKRKRTIVSGPHAKGLEHDSAEYLKELKRFLQSIL